MKLIEERNQIIKSFKFFQNFKALSDPKIQLPTYSSISNFLLSGIQNENNFLINTIDVTNDFLDKFQNIIDKTCLSQFLGKSKDFTGPKYKELQVIKIERIDNPKLWTTYIKHRNILAQEVARFNNTFFPNSFHVQSCLLFIES